MKNETAMPWPTSMTSMWQVCWDCLALHFHCQHYVDCTLWYSGIQAGCALYPFTMTFFLSFHFFFLFHLNLSYCPPPKWNKMEIGEKIIMIKRTPYTQPWFLVDGIINAWLKFLYRHCGVSWGRWGKVSQMTFCSWSVTTAKELMIHCNRGIIFAFPVKIKHWCHHHCCLIFGIQVSSDLLCPPDSFYPHLTILCFPCMSYPIHCPQTNNYI